MRYAILNGNEVVNVILWDGAEEYVPDEGLTIQIATNEVSPGWKFEGIEWIPPVLPDPEPDPIPYEDPAVLEAKNKALTQLMALGITEDVARTIVGLPPLTP